MNASQQRRRVTESTRSISRDTVRARMCALLLRKYGAIRATRRTVYARTWISPRAINPIQPVTRRNAEWASERETRFARGSSSRGSGISRSRFLSPPAEGEKNYGSLTVATSHRVPIKAHCLYLVALPEGNATGVSACRRAGDRFAVQSRGSLKHRAS